MQRPTSAEFSFDRRPVTSWHSLHLSGGQSPRPRYSPLELFMSQRSPVNSAKELTDRPGPLKAAHPVFNFRPARLDSRSRAEGSGPRPGAHRGLNRPHYTDCQRTCSGTQIVKEPVQAQTNTSLLVGKTGKSQHRIRSIRIHPLRPLRPPQADWHLIRPISLPALGSFRRTFLGSFRTISTPQLAWLCNSKESKLAVSNGSLASVNGHRKSSMDIVIVGFVAIARCQQISRSFSPSGLAPKPTRSGVFSCKETSVVSLILW